ncbi:MAG: transcription antitermination factor NusB [Oscillospiraceae bacterium]|nr:transcription antitermination factor NusB [Oscillospiraceae bacterium]
MKRSTARQIAVRLCYMVSENPVTAEEALSQVFEPEYYASLAKEDPCFSEDPGSQREYIDTVVSGIVTHNAELDSYVMQYAVGWKFDRISRTALAVMKVAMYEMLYMPEIPVSVSVNEAVELARQFEDEATVSFINGILGSFSRKELQP